MARPRTRATTRQRAKSPLESNTRTSPSRDVKESANGSVGKKDKTKAKSSLSKKPGSEEIPTRKLPPRACKNESVAPKESSVRATTKSSSVSTTRPRSTSREPTSKAEKLSTTNGGRVEKGYCNGGWSPSQRKKLVEQMVEPTSQAKLRAMNYNLELDKDGINPKIGSAKTSPQTQLQFDLPEFLAKPGFVKHRTEQPAKAKRFPSSPGRGILHSLFNPKYVPDTDEKVRNPFFQTMPGVEVWHRYAGKQLPFGETPWQEQKISMEIEEDLARGLEYEGISPRKNNGKPREHATSSKSRKNVSTTVEDSTSDMSLDGDFESSFILPDVDQKLLSTFQKPFAEYLVER